MKPAESALRALLAQATAERVDAGARAARLGALLGDARGEVRAAESRVLAVLMATRAALERPSLDPAVFGHLRLDYRRIHASLRMLQGRVEDLARQEADARGVVAAVHHRVRALQSAVDEHTKARHAAVLVAMSSVHDDLWLMRSWRDASCA